MKTLRIFWSLMLILGLTLTAACENKQPDTPGASSTISLKASIVEASGDGGEYSINYTITNPVEGGVISAMTTANWIGKWNTDEAGKITFTVAPNNSNEPREAVIEVAYSAIEQSETFTVKQEGSSHDAIRMECIANETTSLTIRVKPLNNDFEYIVRSYTKDYVDVFGLTDSDVIFAHDMDALKHEAGGYGLHNYLQMISHIGQTDHTINNLTPDTDYVVFAYHVDVTTSYPTLVGEVFRIDARTAKPEVSDEIVIDISAELDGTAVLLSMNPGEYDGFYHHGCWSVDDFYTYYGAGADMQDTFIKKWYDTMDVQKSFGKTLSQIFGEFCLRGTKTLTYDELYADTDYVFFAFAIDPDTGFATSECFIEQITTNKAEQNSMTIDIRVENLSSTTADIYWTASDPNGRFARGLYNIDDWNKAGSTDEERLATFVREDVLFKATGSTDMNPAKLTPDTEYIAFAYGVDGGAATTGIFKHKFRSEPKIVGNSVLTISFDNYYLLSDLAAYDPTNFASYESYTGTVLLPVDITVEPYAYDIYYMSMALVSDYYTDDEWLNILKNNQQYDRNHYNFYLYVDTTYTILGAAKDSNGNWGPLFKQEITPTLSGCSDTAGYTHESNN